MTLRIDVVGLGVSAHAVLDGAARDALSSASYVLGSSRQLETVVDFIRHDSAVELPPLMVLRSCIDAYRERGIDRIAILASGDPLYYGIGRWLGRQFSLEKGDDVSLCFHPAISSIQASCHRLALSLQDAKVVSLHGRPLALLRRHLVAQQTLIILTDTKSNPVALAHECRELGFEQANITVCEQLGYEQERVRRFTIDQLLTTPTEKLSFNLLHVSVIETGVNAGFLPSFPGIADEHFITDAESGRGLLSKREVRLTILSLLSPAPCDVVLDIGAGCGGVSIELARWAIDSKVIAVEHHRERLLCLEANRQRFGVVDNLEIIAGRAPDCLDEDVFPSLEAVNKLFIGGSDGELPALLERQWQRLPRGGVLVASAVTETTKQQLLRFISMVDARCETLQLAVSKGGELAGQLLYRPSLPVTLFKLVKVEALDE
ncbi:precorrin-6Y C5,15-methyltransferase (decarboxylating) [Sinobacterium caligoides]|uniref:Precorrin-6Y C5,15-methyltransferase (Decarboxylating) n=1 Tax=Sinobacterium caligoides TaxID=933926 RepID=A0A3N2DYF1_9GAMM|nr:precorrin-6y C5,15-methyltransferase (decarboxylating) subunit CbiE [Sinobacterium caligoides]ROS04890.1 precorrin-6Y C5,15-methyltransferase (decarboxylating) [Sinobacterium caligoides]